MPKPASLRRPTAATLVISLVATLLLLVTPVFAQESGRAVPADLFQKAWDKGKVRVIVELGGVGAVPEGQLSSLAAVIAQRGRIASDRAALRAALRGLRHRVLREFKTVPYMGLEVDHDALRVLDSLPGLATSVQEDILLQPTLAESGPLIQAPIAQAAGWDGTGQTIAIIDTGVDKTHPFLAGKVVEEACYDSSGTSTCPNGLTTDTSPGAGMPCTFAPSDCAHGTHVAGIAAGSDSDFSGVAPGASLIAIQVFHLADCNGTPCALTWFTDIISALERVVDLHETYSIASVNMSFGVTNLPFGAPCDASTGPIGTMMAGMIQTLRSLGTASVVASGNDGFPKPSYPFSALSFPACLSGAISVGATSDGSGGPASDLIMSFSNSASFLSLLAPGYLINSSVPGDGFANFAGTSMATPHVAGAWAVMKQQDPDASVQSVLDGLKNTGKPIKDPRNGVTKSRIAFTVLQFAASAHNVAESVGSASITLTRTGATFGTVSVRYATNAGTAIPGQDYSERSGTVTFGPNETFKTFSVPVINDTGVDGPRTVHLTLTNPGGGALLGPQNTALLTIDDNDVGGSIQFSADQYTVNEGQGTATITLSRANGSASNVSVHYATMAGTATSGADYTESSGTVTFGAGQTSRTFTIPIVNDTLAEGPETVLLQLSSPTGGAILGPRQTAVLTIVDNDPAGSVKFSTSSFTTPDADGDAIITVTRSSGTGAGATVKVATGAAGTAMPGTHYDPISPTTLEFVGNAATTTFKVKIHGNTTAGDGNKTVELLLSEPGGGATLGSPSKATLTIVNNDFGGALSFLTSSVSVSESSSTATITVRRTGGIAGGVTVDVLATNGTAKLGLDYGAPNPATLVFDPGDTQKTFDVPILFNPSAVASRSFTLKLQNAVGGATLGSPATATLTITKAGIRFSQTAYFVNQGSSATITIMRSSTTPGATVKYATEDGADANPDKNAQANTDYQPIAPTQLSPAFGSGQTSRTFVVNTLNSGVHGNRTLLLHLSDASGDPLGEPSTATLTILGAAQPELQVTAFAPPELAILGKSFAAQNTVRNLSGTAAGASTLQFFLSTDSTWDPGDIFLGQRSVPALAAGATSSATTTLTVPANAAPAGNYWILAFVDATGLVTEQDEANNVWAQPLTVVFNLVKTFNLSGNLTNTGCANVQRNDSMVVQGTLAFSTQVGKALTGVLTLTSPGTNYKTTGPVKAMVDESGSALGAFTYTTTEGSTVVSKGSGTLAGTTDGSSLAFPFTLTGIHATGETCDFSVTAISPAAPWLRLTFHHRAVAGGLGEQDGAFVATPDFPIEVDSFRALVDIAVDSPLPTLDQVRFTSPDGEVFSDTPAAELSQVATNAAVYRSPFSTSPPTAPSGPWIVNHKGFDVHFNPANQDVEEHLAIPSPTFVLNSSGSLSQVTWVLKDPTGVPFSELSYGQPPYFMTSVQVQIFDACGVMRYDSNLLLPATTSKTISPAVPLSQVAEVRFLYKTVRKNVYTIHYGAATPGQCKVVEFSAPAYSVGEKGTSASVGLRRVGDLTGSLTVQFHTEDGSASAADDYVSVDRTVTFAPGATTATVTVPIVDNLAPNASKTVHLFLTHADPDPNPEMVLGPLSTALLTIKDDEPTLRLNSAAYVAGEGSASFNVTVIRSGPTTSAVSVDLVPQQISFATGGACGVGGADFSNAVIPVTIPAGQGSKTVPVVLCPDTLPEGTESFGLALQNPSGATLASPSTATVNLTDNEVAGTFRWSAAEVSGVEGTTLQLTVTRTGGTASDVQVFFAAYDGDANTPGSDAQSGVDYTVVTPLPLTFGQNVLSQTVEISLLPTDGVQGPRAFRVVLEFVDSGATLGNPSTITGWILDPPPP